MYLYIYIYAVYIDTQEVYNCFIIPFWGKRWICLFLVVSPLGLRKYRRPDGCHTTIHLPGNTKKSDSNRWFDGLGLDVKKGKLGKLLHDDLRHSMALQQNVSCAAKRKLGMVTQNEGSASSRSKSHTVCVYIYVSIYTYNIRSMMMYVYIYTYTLHCRIWGPIILKQT